MAEDEGVALRRFLDRLGPHLPPIHWQVDPEAGLTLAEAVLHFASEDDAERHKRLAVGWGDPHPDMLDGVEGLEWRTRRADLHALEYRLTNDRLAQLASGELVATALDLGDGMLAPRIRVPADLLANPQAGRRKQHRGGAWAAAGRHPGVPRCRRAPSPTGRRLADDGRAGAASRPPRPYSLRGASSLATSSGAEHHHRTRPSQAKRRTGQTLRPSSTASPAPRFKESTERFRRVPAGSSAVP